MTSRILNRQFETSGVRGHCVCILLFVSCGTIIMYIFSAFIYINGLILSMSQDVFRAAAG